MNPKPVGSIDLDNYGSTPRVFFCGGILLLLVAVCLGFLCMAALIALKVIR
jgi:hypothetical protein